MNSQWLCLLVSMAFLPAARAQQVDLLSLTHLQDYRALRSSSNNPDPESNDDSKRPIPGETIVLGDLQGPGMVTHIWLTVAANEYGWPRLLRLRIYYDGSATPSVDAPVGDFFGVGHGFERDINSLVVRDSSSGRSRNCYWPMPFRRACRITITNEGRRRVSNLYYHVDWRKVPSLPADTTYFHALYRQALPAAAGQPYEVLAVEGRGHYVGTVMSVIQTAAGWFGEGDDRIYVDGEKTAGIQGTGTEDYFNDAWSLREAAGPYFGVPVAEGTDVGARMTAYRWHLPDPIPFTRSFRFDFEHAGWTYNPDGTVRSAFEERPDLFSSVAFWYQEGIAKGLPEPPYGPARLPHGNARQIEVEDSIAQVRTENGKAEVQKDVFWSRDLLFLNAAAPGARMTIPFNVEQDGHYELTAQIAHAPDYGIYETLLDGKSTTDAAALEREPGANTGGGGPVNAWHTEVYVAVDHMLAWRKLAKGTHTVTFVCTGKDARSTGYNLGIDTLILARVGQVEPVAPPPELTPHAAMRALADPDPVIRGVAALTLRDAGAAAYAALDLLIARLKDPDENVRLMSAEAIARQGKRAARAVPALIAACEVPGEHVHVQRSAAGALGAIGPEAAAALPVLRKLEAIPRVRWAARAAIREIGGEGR
ncbi:MAG TPA: DUF2961 domain-containing protein [Bryobacteraceae bacterium]|nr:DUF2961 domain-containing protein [Bryobacteraceae bacterium]